MNKGFTLVELSIVLVIIGLLIGGILVGQSMIESSKVGKIVSEIQQYNAIITNFKTTYGKLPGDITTFPNPGDGDGTIDYPGAGAQGEWLRVWQHLYEAEMVNVAYTGLKNGTLVVPGENQPESEVIKDLTYSILYYAGSGFITRATNYLFIGAPEPTSVGLKGNIRTQMASAIDFKMDDGSADTGNLTTWESRYQQQTCHKNYVQSVWTLSSGEYNIDNPDGLCSLMYYADFN